VIAQAAVFAGTSLHGAITAISYAVPHVGLRDCVPKVDTFLADWDLPEQQACVEASGLAAGMQRAMALPRARLEARAAALKSACSRAFDEMIQCLR
jgi:polysaccharide pyruvyl transferase WcaK-like protein